MKYISQYQFIQEILKDYPNINGEVEHKTYMNQYPIVNNKRKINSFYDAIIFDNDGNKHPYMLNMNQRNEDKLLDFDYISITRNKSLFNILKEANLTLKSEPCKISEGGGWYSDGNRYFYKDFYCEI